MCMRCTRKRYCYIGYIRVVGNWRNKWMDTGLDRRFGEEIQIDSSDMKLR